MTTFAVAFDGYRLILDSLLPKEHQTKYSCNKAFSFFTWRQETGVNQNETVAWNALDILLYDNDWSSEWLNRHFFAHYLGQWPALTY